eukprot:TRINITY_DN275_c0_g1_i1.p3 TRINITY_DN275_c0_g1~~TRINITY_DN275_c0_g1_i1.p3  ORF type:complete len:58 (+),score=33.08 TRINITY_DN275_c0_g1_i1:289-462(+)
METKTKRSDYRPAQARPHCYGASQRPRVASWLNTPANKKKKYRLRGRSSETAKAHRG